jgi:adenosylmethionine-8-amino-7-oxononanoate aminotransferase
MSAAVTAGHLGLNVLVVEKEPLADEGKAGDHILLAPPFIVTERDIDQIVDILGVVIDKSIAGAR